MTRTLITLSSLVALLFFPVLAGAQYTPPGNPFLAGDDPCEDDFLIPTLGGGEVQVQPCPSGNTGGGENPGGGGNTGGGGGGGGSTTRGGGRRPIGNLIRNGRRLVPVTPIPVTPLPEEEEESVLRKPVWDPLRRPRIRHVVPGTPIPYEPAAPMHAAAPLPSTGTPLGIHIAVSMGSAFLLYKRRPAHSPSSTL